MPDPIINSRQQPGPEDEGPFNEAELLPSLGIAALWVVCSYVIATLLLLPVHPL